MKERTAYFDILRGIAIIGVIAIHSTGIGYDFDSASIGFIGTVFWRQMINFSVPLFLVLSGYFLANKKVANKSDYWNFLKKQIPRVYIPFLLWSILYSGIELAQGKPAEMTILRLIAFQATGPFYFIFLIIQYYILLPFLKRMATTRGVFLSATISLFTCLIIYYFRFYTEFSIPLIIYAGGFPTWIVFFVLGLYLRNNRVTVSNKLIVLLLILFFSLSCLETYWVFQKLNNIQEAVTAVKISSFLYSIALILFAFKNITAKVNTTLAFIGEVSFGVYLSHMLFLSGINTILNNVAPELNSYGLIKQVILVTLTLMCCTLFIYLLRKFNKRIAIEYLGQ